MKIVTMLGGALLGLALVAGCTSDSGDSSADAKSRNAAQPTITLNPANFSFSVTQGDADPVHTVDISNTGNGTLDWSVNSTTSWLTLSPMSGRTSGNTPTTFSVKANLSGLAAGNYSGTITVAGDNASNNPQAIPVTLIISASTSSPSTPSTTSSSPPASTTTTSSPPPPSTTTTSPPSPPPTVSVAIAWDGTGLGTGGYYVHYGTQSPNVAGSCAYPQSVFYSLTSLSNASAPSAVINGLTSGGTYYFAVSAYDGKLESPCSNEIWRVM